MTAARGAASRLLNSLTTQNQICQMSSFLFSLNETRQNRFAIWLFTLPTRNSWCE